MRIGVSADEGPACAAEDAACARYLRFEVRRLDLRLERFDDRVRGMGFFKKRGEMSRRWMCVCVCVLP